MQDNFKFVSAAMKKDFTPVAIYTAGAICIFLFSLSDSLTIAETLNDAFAWPIPYLFGFGVILTNELIFFGVIFAFKNLCAFGKISMATWAFYFSLVICLGGIGIYSALNIIRHIEALGAKNRAVNHQVDFSADPALVRADAAVNELRRQIASSDSSISGVARAASGMATASMAFVKAAKGDTGRVKRDQLFYAARANRSSANVTSVLNDLQRGRQSLLTSLLHAQDRRDSVFSALDRRYRGRSAQDVVEADMGINLKGRVATLTVVGTIGVMLVMMMTAFAYGGKAEFFPFRFSPRSALALHPTNAPASSYPSSPVASIIPAMGAGENRSQYVRRIADMWLRKELPPYVSQAFLAAQFEPKMSAPRFCKIVAQRRRVMQAMPD